jgi:single-strand DNA-binding protein
MNSLNFIGHLGRDPEVKSLPDGKQVCVFSVAVSRGSKRDRQSPMWIDVTVYGKQGESCAKYLSKGRQVAVTGTLYVREYVAGDGTKKTSIGVATTSIDFLTGNRKSQDATVPPAAQIPADDSDIPF